MSFVFGVIALRKFSGSSGCTKVVLIPIFRNVTSNCEYVPPYSVLAETISSPASNIVSKAVICADIPDDTLSIESWSSIYGGANWHEREAWEMYGVNFAGHPSLRNLYLPGDFEGHPLRKDFPLLARHVKPWPGIVDVEVTATPAWRIGELTITGLHPLGQFQRWAGRILGIT